MSGVSRHNDNISAIQQHAVTCTQDSYNQPKYDVLKHDKKNEQWVK